MKSLFYLIMFIVFALVTFFGLGPVLLADGSMNERLMTLLIVMLLYVVLGWITFRFRKGNGSNRKNNNINKMK